MDLNLFRWMNKKFGFVVCSGFYLGSIWNVLVYVAYFSDSFLSHIADISIVYLFWISISYTYYLAERFYMSLMGIALGK